MSRNQFQVLRFKNMILDISRRSMGPAWCSAGWPLSIKQIQLFYWEPWAGLIFQPVARKYAGLWEDWWGKNQCSRWMEEPNPHLPNSSTAGSPCGHLNKEHYCSSAWQAAANTPSVTLRGPDLPPLFQQENGLNASTEHMLLFQISPCSSSSWYKGCAQKHEACPQKWLSVMSCCTSVTSVRVPKRTGLAKGWAGIVIATETAAGRGAIRCCNLENSCTFYAGEDSSKMDVGTWVCLCSVSAFIYACPCCHSVCSAAWSYKVSCERVKSSPCSVSPWTSLKSLLFFLFMHQPEFSFRGS